MRADSQNRRRCPICDNEKSDALGKILHPSPTFIAGSLVDLGDTNFELRRCGHCMFQFKDPVVPETMLKECYANSSEDFWGRSTTDSTQRFQEMTALLGIFDPGRTILDIGCHNGSFLRNIKQEHVRFGIEPSQRAAQQAASHGINILGKSIFDVDPKFHQFDRITVMDVVEHVVEPLPFLARARDLLAPGGILLLQTGDSAAWQWRLERNLHWYCSLPEHVSFYCATTLDFVAAQLGMKRLYYRRMRQRSSTLAQRIIETSKNVGFIAGNRLRGLRLRRLEQMFLRRRAPVWITARDHMIYVCQKPSQ